MNANDLESLSKAWPGVASSIKWEDDLVFTVAGKMFAVYCLRGPHRERVSFKVDPERFLELTDQPGIAPAAYMARAFWISIAEPDRFAQGKLAEFVRHSYELVRAGLSKKQQALLAAKEALQMSAVPADLGKVATMTQAVKSSEVVKTSISANAKASRVSASADSAKAATAPAVTKARKTTRLRGA